jgi:hypothetical protein
VLSVDDAAHRKLGVKTYNRCWELLEQPERSRDDDLELLTLAFTSKYHWSFVAADKETIIGEWMIARAAAAVGEGHLSVTYAKLAHDLAQASGVEDWLVASSAEGVARAYAASGDLALRDEWCERAEGLVAAIADLDERALIASQLASVPR